MFTTSLYNLQKENPSTFAVMMTRSQRKKLSNYLLDFGNEFKYAENTGYSNIADKLMNGHMSYSDSELKIMRAAITWNKFLGPLSFIVKQYIKKSIEK